MKFILGIIVGIILLPVLAVGYLMTGLAPAAATDKPMPFEAYIAGTALNKKIQKEAPTRDLSTMTTSDLLSGADTYKQDCAFCHGLPDSSSWTPGDNMFPPAPQLMRSPPPRPGNRGPQGPPNGAAGQPGPNSGLVQGRGASGDFWRVKNGVRLTGMPSFEKTLSDDQMWEVVALIAKRRNLPPEVKAALEPQPATAPAPNGDIKPPKH